MSGAAGGSRIDRENLKQTIRNYRDNVIKPLGLDSSYSITGVRNRRDKYSYGDIDIVLAFKEGDRVDLKQDLAKHLSQVGEIPTMPHKKDKKYFIHGNIVTTLYPISGREGEYVQIDNIVSVGKEEGKFTHNMLDLPAEQQTLAISLVKAVFTELNNNQIQNLFRQLGITNPEQPGEGEEYDFNLNPTELSLRIVPIGKNDGREIWKSTNFADVKKIPTALGIDIENDTFSQILSKIKQFKERRSVERFKGLFNRNIRVGAAEKDTEKGNTKQQALDAVAALQEQNQQKVIAVFPGKFKPPHKDHIARIKAAAQDADEVIVLVSPKTEPGGTARTKKDQERLQDRLQGEQPITADQSLQIFKLANLPSNVTIMRSDDPKLPVPAASPVTAAYEVFKNNPDQQYIAVFGKEEDFSRYGTVPPNVVIKNYDNAAGNISATDVRKALKTGKDLSSYLPDGVDQEKYKEIILGKSPSDSIEDKMLTAVDEVFESFFPKKKHDLYLDEGKFAYPKPLSSYFQKALQEISFSTSNAVKVKGGTMSGTFLVGDSKYRYSITPFAKSPYGDDGSFYNIAFHPISSRVSTPQEGKENYVKILSTMYKIIIDFIEKHQPEYVGIGSLDNEEGKNYHIVYASLTDNKANRIPGYFRKDVSMPFNSPDGPGRMVVMKKKKEVNPLDEGSSGTPIQPSGAIPSKDRAELEHLFNDLKQTVDSDKFTVVFNQDKIDIYIKTYSDVAVDQTPYQKHLPEGAQQQKFNYTPYIGSILEYMLDQGMKVYPLPEIKIRYDEQEANDFFGKTAYYNPGDKEVVLYAMGRHPKDVCRSFTHEMIHHMQNLEGRIGNGRIKTTNVNEDDYLQSIEKEAHEKGSYIFREWEDSTKKD